MGYALIIGEGPTLRFAQDRLVATDLDVAAKASGAVLFTTQGHPVVSLPAIDGWLVGDLFERPTGRAVSGLPSASQLAIASSQGQHLLDRYHGRYLGFWRSHGTATASFLRDPSGFARAFAARFDGGVCIASDPRLVSIACGRTPLVDWQSLAHHLRFPDLPTARTCLLDIEELLPGELVVGVGKDRVRRQLWAPKNFTAGGQPRQPALSDRLAGIIDDVVGAWATNRRVLLEMSGGLDSSIIASALAYAGADWSGITLATREAGGDERAYARRVAEHSAVELVERSLDDVAVDPLSAPRWLTPRPGGLAAQRGFGEIVVEVAQEVGATTLMSGTGGDNIFCYLSSTAPVLDAWRALGWRAARRVALDVSIQCATTRRDVMRGTLRRATSALWRSRRWAPDDRFLDQAIGVQIRPHPWLMLPRRAPHGFWGHVASVLRAQAVMHGHDRAWSQDMIYPLLSQPVMELCFSVPSWEWVAGGRDRAVARDAYASRLPEAIVSRREKGDLSASIARAFDRRRRDIRSLLHEGLLARHRLIDMRAIDSCLGRHADADLGWIRVLELADAERWARHVVGLDTQA
jgi:asparagine synthase (glutamine-hydrolysing)